MACCVYSLESPKWGDSNENTQHTFMLMKIENISLLCFLALWLTYIGSNYPCLEHILMVQKLFEPLKSTNCAITGSKIASTGAMIE